MNTFNPSNKNEVREFQLDKKFFTLLNKYNQMIKNVFSEYYIDTEEQIIVGKGLNHSLDYVDTTFDPFELIGIDEPYIVKLDSMAVYKNIKDNKKYCISIGVDSYKNILMVCDVDNVIKYFKIGELITPDSKEFNEYDSIRIKTKYYKSLFMVAGEEIVMVEGSEEHYRLFNKLLVELSNKDGIIRLSYKSFTNIKADYECSYSIIPDEDTCYCLAKFRFVRKDNIVTQHIFKARIFK